MTAEFWIGVALGAKFGFLFGLIFWMAFIIIVNWSNLTGCKKDLP